MRIDIWSDLICPWCYLGLHRFEQALTELGWTLDDPDLTIRLHAFELDPLAPAEPRPLRPTIERKYGPGSFDAMTTRLTRLGDAEGLDYRFDLAKRVNTNTAHRVLAWATESDPTRTFDVARQLFEAYFTRGADLGDADVLADAAAAAGYDRATARHVAIGHEYTGVVREDEDHARDIGVTGVPAFVLDEQLVLPGAQDVDTFVHIFGRARQRSTSR